METTTPATTRRELVDATPPVSSPVAGKTPRIVGVDVARGFALLGMMAVHVYDTFNQQGTPSVATVVADGRSAATFALVAGVSLALITGGRRPVAGRARSGAAAGIAVRALLIGAIGLMLGYTGTDIEVILPYYAVFFLLAIPLLGRPPKVLASVAAACVVVAPLLLLATFNADLSTADGSNPTFATLVQQPLGLTLDLLLTGTYPALIFLAYIAAGLAIGRLDLSARRVAVRLLGGGLGLVLTGWAVSWVLLYPLGGLHQLLAAGAAPSEDAGVSATNAVLWDMGPAPTWWWLTGRAPHTGTPVDLVLTLGAAMAVLGAALLVTRSRLGARLLSPVAAAGTMTLTVYSAHLLLLATGVLDDNPTAQYLLLVTATLAFAVIWRRWRGQGPLEKLVGAAAGRARRAVTAAGREPAAATVGQAGAAAGSSPGGCDATAR